MGRVPCCDKANVKRGPWSPEEDAALRSYVEKHHGTVSNWIAMPQKAGLRRCGKSCRLRWLNYLRPDIKHGCFTEEEDNIICTLYNNIGSRWSVIASNLPGRTDNDVKNYWNTKLKKKLILGTSSSMNSPNSAPKPPLPTAPPPPPPPPPAPTGFTATTDLDSGGLGFNEEYLYRFLSKLPPFPTPSSPVTLNGLEEGGSEIWSANGCYNSSGDVLLLSDLGTAGSYSSELPLYYSSSPSHGTKAQGLYQNVTYS